MGRIKFKMTDERFNELRATANSFGETNDCSVIAVAAVTGIAYEVVHAEMERLGRRRGRGTPLHISEQTIKNLGFHIEHITPQYFISRYPGAHKTVQNTTSHHPDRFNKVWADGYNYVVASETHMLAIMDGKNVDWSRGRSFQLKRIWRVVKEPTGEVINEHELLLAGARVREAYRKEQLIKKFGKINEKFDHWMAKYDYSVNQRDWAIDRTASELKLSWGAVERFLETGRMTNRYGNDI